MVSPRRRRRPLPDRRHLVADRDRRHPDQSAARRDRPEARLGDAAVLRRATRPSSTTTARRSKAPCEGNLVLTDSWPGQMRTVFGDHQRFIDTYFRTFPGRYFTGDGARRDEDGYYWITGRVDDVLNVAGHRLGTAEIESALVAHQQGRRSGGRRLSARHQGPGHLCLRHARARCRADRRAAQGTARVGAPRDRADRDARLSSSGRRACRRRAPARSCAASCARSRPTSSTSSATSRRSPIRRWWSNWCAA